MKNINRFIIEHIKQITKPYFQTKPNRYPTLDKHISTYFRSHKSIGSGQRKLIYDKTYDLIRYHHYLNHLCKGSKDVQLRIKLLHTSDFYYEMDDKKLPKWIRTSFPQNLYDKIQESVKNEYETFQLCKALNTRAPLTVRINPSKTTRSDFMKKIGKYLKIQFEKTQFSPYGLKIPNNKNILLYQTQQFKQGHFQIQDQASQIASLQVKCKPGDLVLDFCSGSGGKSLAIAHLLEGKGQIFLHDPRQYTLQNAKIRFQRAGYTNVQFHSDQSNLQKNILNKVDWIILDVPCSGTGTIRRNPDIKFRFSEHSLKKNIMLQQQIIQKSVKYLKKDGKIVYITCSLLAEENEQQIKKCVRQFDLQVVGGQFLKIKTTKNGMDSMFAVVLQKKR